MDDQQPFGVFRRHDTSVSSLSFDDTSCTISGRKGVGMRILRSVAFVAWVGAALALPAADLANRAPVLMICEHGSVKSVMAATLFNQAAIERKLPFRAIPRGVTPDAAVPP